MPFQSYMCPPQFQSYKKTCDAAANPTVPPADSAKSDGRLQGRNAKLAPPPSGRGAFQPAQKAPGMEDERSHYSELRWNYLTSKGIKNPDYVMTARERVDFFQFAREWYENSQEKARIGTERQACTSA